MSKGDLGHSGILPDLLRTRQQLLPGHLLSLAEKRISRATGDLGGTFYSPKLAKEWGVINNLEIDALRVVCLSRHRAVDATG
jgi:hypothetical protein